MKKIGKVAPYLLVLVFLTGCATPSGYKNVRSESKLSQVQLGMGVMEVRKIVGEPTDYEEVEDISTQVAWLPMQLLIVGLFFAPSGGHQTFYYKNEGRVYFDTGWGVPGTKRSYRVVAVEGNPNEKGYR